MTDRHRGDQEEAAAWETIASWEGNDRRFDHRRASGEPHGGTAWKDRFGSRNPASPIAAIARREDFFDLDPGLYRLQWDAHLFFRNPACRTPSTSVTAMQTTVVRRLGGAPPVLSHTQLDQVYVCGARADLIYELGIELVFRCQGTERGLDFEFYAYNDADHGGRTDTNIQEVIIYRMTLSRRT